MAVPTCRAKDPNSCRVHGNGGVIEKFQQIADKAAAKGNMGLYMETRAQIDSMTDETTQPTFIAPNTGNLLVENWKDKAGDIIPEAPNDMLVSNLYQRAFHSLEDKEQDQMIAILRSREYSDNDLYHAKYFGFKKNEYGESHATYTSYARVIVAARELEQKSQVTPSNDEREKFARKYFDLDSSEMDATLERCEKFATSYEEYLSTYPKH